MGLAGTEPEGFLHPVYSELVNGPFPRSVLGWLRRSNGGPRILAGLAGGEIPTTHEGLDQVGGKVADFVRSMLTATGVLPERNSDVVRFESWLNAYIGGRPGGTQGDVAPVQQLGGAPPTPSNARCGAH